MCCACFYVMLWAGQCGRHSTLWTVLGCLQLAAGDTPNEMSAADLCSTVTAPCLLSSDPYRLPQLLRVGCVAFTPPVPTVSEADLKQVDIQEGYQVDLAPGSALPCVVSFAPGQERRVYFAGGRHVR
jgi:hypothetical protein